MDRSATSLAQLYEEVGPSLLAYLDRYLRDRHVAEDVLQETFYQAARYPSRVAHARSPRAWLFGTARKVVATVLRRRKTTQRLPQELAADERVVDPRIEVVERALGELPAAQREILGLRLRCELSYEELADVLEIPLGTVRSRLHHAVRYLREKLVSAEL